MTRSSAASPTATARLKQDYLRLKKDPVPFISAEPLPSNILEWHYVVEGPPGSPYETGHYHGKLIFPREFPFRPPSIYMITPSGRFKVNTRLCLSISDFHPDTWNPAWSVSTILTGLLSFMLENTPTFGSLQTSDHTKRHLASQSAEFNLSNSTFCELFPDLVERLCERQRQRQEEQQQQQQRRLSSQQSDSRASTDSGGSGNDRLVENGIRGLSNLLLIACVAVLCYVAKTVLGGGGGTDE